MDLHIPLLNKPGKGSFNTNPQAVKQWVADLPLINTALTVSLLQQALDDINSTRAPVYDRYEALEQFSGPVHCVTDALKKQFLGKRFPLGGKPLEQANLATSLCMAMATGYKIVAAELNKKNKGSSQLSKVIHQAMRYLGEALLDSYLIYIPCPAGTWRDLNSLYALADRHKLADSTAKGKPAPVHDVETIADTYKRILLLSLACPYRLRQSEITKVYALLGDWAYYSDLTIATDTDASGYFTVHLEADEPPHYLNAGHRDKLDPSWLIINTRGLAEPARTTIEKTRESTASLSTLPDEKVLQRLMLAWGVMPRRQFTRRGNEASVQIVVGLDSIHLAIAGPDATLPGINNTADETVQDGEYLRDPTFEQPTRINTETRLNQNATNNPFRGAYAPDSRNGNGLHIESWKMQDISAGGYSLLRDSAETSHAHVGELVAINEADSNADWHLGVIRWMKFTPEAGLTLGAQMLSPGARPVQASICTKPAGMEEQRHGILLPALAAIDQPETLLLPSLPFRSGCLSSLTEADNTQKIRLTQLLENTGSFAQFRFAAAGID